MALRTGFQSVSEDMQRLAYEIFAGIGQTKCVEDSFKAVRAFEQRASSNGKVSLSSRWAIPIKEGILTKKHRFPEIVPFLGSTCCQNRSKLFPKSFHHARSKACSLPDLKAIVSSKDPSWPTFTGQSQSKLVGDLALL
eukprot:5990887-Lingulodinium_polyedra.AAC.1